MAGREMRGHHANTAICRAVNFITVDHERSSPRICLVPRASTSFPLALFEAAVRFTRVVLAPNQFDTKKRKTKGQE